MRGKLAKKMAGKPAKRTAGKLLLMSMLLFQSCATFRQETSTETNPIDTVLTTGFFNSSQIAISVYDLTDNKTVYEHNEKLLLHPASNQKILTTTAACLFLGNDYKFTTGVYHTGEIKDSVCNGDVYFAGGFDPDFSLHDMDSLCFQIKNFGIKKINGNLYADVSAMDSLFWGKGWMWDDDPYSFMPYLTPLNINKDNVTIITSPSGINQHAQVTVIPATSFFELKNTSITTDTGKTRLNVTRDWLNRKNTILVEGTINKSSLPDTTVLNVFNPTLYFLQLAKEKCERAGITISGRIDSLTISSNAEKIIDYSSSIKEVIENANKNSDNLNAEMLLRALAYKFSGKHASAQKGLKFLDSLITLAGFNSKNYRLVDGSGLSHYNLVSAELLNGILKYIYYRQPDIFKMIFDSLPVSGLDGTLKHRMKTGGLFKHVHAKTGTLSGISALSGYLESKNDHLLSFSIFVQNYTGHAKQAHTIQDELCKIFCQMY